MKCGQSNGKILLEWEASPAGDLIADAVVALIMHAQSSAASIRLTSKPCRHSRPTPEDDQPASKRKREDRTENSTEARLRLIHEALKKEFEDVEATYEGNQASFEIKTDTSLESGVLDEDGFLRCTVKVEFENAMGVNAKVEVESKDEKLAANVQESVKNVASIIAPIS